MVNDMTDILNIKNCERLSLDKSEEKNQHTKTQNSPFNNLEKGLFSRIKYRIKIIIATKTRETLKNVFIALNPKMSKQAGFKNVAKANRINKNLIIYKNISYKSSGISISLSDIRYTC